MFIHASYVQRKKVYKAIREAIQKNVLIFCPDFKWCPKLKVNLPLILKILIFFTCTYTGCPKSSAPFKTAVMSPKIDHRPQRKVVMQREVL